MDNLLEQITNISKAHAYDIVVDQVNDLTIENKKLKERVKYLEDLISEYSNKMLVNLSGDKVKEFLKDQII